MSYGYIECKNDYDEFKHDHKRECRCECKYDHKRECRCECHKCNTCCCNKCREKGACMPKPEPKHNLVIKVIDFETGCPIINSCFVLIDECGKKCELSSDKFGCIKVCINPCVCYKLIQTNTDKCHCFSKTPYCILKNCCGDIFVNGVRTKELVIANKKVRCHCHNNNCNCKCC